MREIIFRGKAVIDFEREPFFEFLEREVLKNGDWIQGDLIWNNGTPFIVHGVIEANDEYISLEWWCPVAPETVGQFTGLLDKHGRKIFEGDIVVTCPSPLSISDGSDASKRRIVDSGVYTGMCYSAMCRKGSKVEKYYKIVGNVYDNPELLT